MSAAEIALHVRKKVREWVDTRSGRTWSTELFETSPVFPKLPPPATAPDAIHAALKRDAEEILAGRWRAFHHLDLHVDDPPHWQRDYRVGTELAETKSSFGLNHRQLPDGADVKLIWELSRWQPLVRLAQAAYILSDGRAARKCTSWLRNWLETNPPYHGWNWTSALESGIRLIQFTWIDALLLQSHKTVGVATGETILGDGGDFDLHTLRRELLPPHVHYTWRHRTFGSSANNHLLGELAGLILAISRWPELTKWSAPLKTLRELWEREVLSQFAEDGGNHEQALNYHLFSWELCWQTHAALKTAGLSLTPEVEDRLSRAADFYVTVQTPKEPWDYGDSDNATVTPFFLDERTAAKEWLDWLSRGPSCHGLSYWLGEPPSAMAGAARIKKDDGWLIYPHSGIAIGRHLDWLLRWDLSPLGYLATAAHGHLDALHLSMWIHGHALVIDPGTGAYYGDPGLRTYLASWAAHNGPRLASEDFPRRLGPFLWSAHHDRPCIGRSEAEGMTSALRLPSGVAERRVSRIPGGELQGWAVDDAFRPFAGTTSKPFLVGWQFAPGWRLSKVSDRKFLLTREKIEVHLEVDPAWSSVEAITEAASGRLKEAATEMQGTCSPAFRKLEFGPMLLLTGQAHESGVFRTTFLAVGHS